MQKIYLVLLLSIFSITVSRAQSEPPIPTICNNFGPDAKNNMTVTGNTTFTFSNVSDFATSQSSNTISVNVLSSNQYKLYIAGYITYSGSPNTPIPINTFTVSATNPGSSPASITLSNSYQEVAQSIDKKGVTHVLTITRNPLPNFTQAPGTHTLTLHLRYCQY